MNTAPALTGIFECKGEFTLEEASGEVDGQHIIGKVRGPFFVPDGTSRNNRFYSKSLWEKQLARPEVKEKIKNRQMFGTISHEQPLDDKAFLEGKVSHIVTKLEVEGGLGEALILGTPAGQMLKIYLGAKAKLFTSSRANGKFEGERNGVPMVDEDNYFLKTFDFVTDPGFLQANPSLVEKLEAIVRDYKPEPKPNNPKGEFNMDKEVFEALVKEKSKLEENLGSATTELEKAKNDLILITDENNHIKDQIVELEKKAVVAATFEELGGTADEIKEKLSSFDELTKSLEDIGSVEQISEALTLGEQMGDDLKEIKDEFGDIEDLKTAFDLAEKRLDDYEECGSVEQINKIMDFADNVNESNNKSEVVKRSETLSEELKVPAEKIAEVYFTFVGEDKIGDKEGEIKLKEFFTGLSEVKSNRSNWIAPAVNLDESNTDKKPSTYKERMAESRSKRIMARFQ